MIGSDIMKLSQKAKNINNVKFLVVGNLAAEIGKELEKSAINTVYFDNNKDVALYILDKLDVGTTIFLKASRSMKFEEIINNLKGENSL